MKQIRNKTEGQFLLDKVKMKKMYILQWNNKKSNNLNKKKVLLLTLEILISTLIGWEFIDKNLQLDQMLYGDKRTRKMMEKKIKDGEEEEGEEEIGAEVEIEEEVEAILADKEDKITNTNTKRSR